MQNNYNKKMQGHQMVQICRVPVSRSGQRIDNYLFSHCKQWPKSAIYRLIRKGAVRINDKKIKASTRVMAHDCIRLPKDKYANEEKRSDPLITQTQDSIPSHKKGVSRKVDFGWLKPCILFENSDFIVLNKPTGVAVHAGSGIYHGVIEGLNALRSLPQSEAGDAESMVLVHRLDKATSGCLLVAKNYPSLKALQLTLRDGVMQKTYLAIVHGVWAQPLPHSITDPLAKNRLRSGERMVCVDPNGKAAHTEVVAAWADKTRCMSVLKLRLHTGRTHQIRVHLQQQGYPIVNDVKYGSKKRDALPFSWRRLCLHANSIKFSLGVGPRQKHYAFEASPPSPLQEVMQAICLCRNRIKELGQCVRDR